VTDYYAGRSGVITGAGAGIGRALAVDLARRGARLALWDANPDALAETADLCRRVSADSRSSDVRAQVVDVTNVNQLSQHAADTVDAFGRLDLAFCVAGVIHTGTVLASASSDIERVLDVNLRGTIHTVSALLPHLLASGDGHLVTMSSTFGLIALPKYSAYCASKFAIRGYTEALRLEMAVTGRPVAVSCVVPGGVRTQIVSRGTFADDEDPAAISRAFDRRLARTTPEQAARQILRGVQRRKPQILIGADARLVALLMRATGAGYQRILPRLLGYFGQAGGTRPATSRRSGDDRG
jgi:NAD(P)-dependent dehydrogenase (short-subunit alcohol dehydrogenase family)